jgi:hypothetical protein
MTSKIRRWASMMAWFGGSRSAHAEVSVRPSKMLRAKETLAPLSDDLVGLRTEQLVAPAGFAASTGAAVGIIIEPADHRTRSTTGDTATDAAAVYAVAGGRKVSAQGRN